MKNVLVTGGAGFIGSSLCKYLIDEGCQVTVLDSLSEQVHTEDPEQSFLYKSLPESVRFVRGSVLDRDVLSNVLVGQEAIVHLAAETGTGQSMYQIERYVSANVQGTALIFDVLASMKHDVKRIVIASSRSIYGEGKYKLKDGTTCYPTERNQSDMDAGLFEVTDGAGTFGLELCATDEESKIHPSSVYGITKQFQEQLVMTVAPTLGIEPVALRYQNVYGPGQSLVNPYTGILSIFSNLILNHQPINIFEDGLESRDFVYIDDVVRATALAIHHDGAAGQIFNVGSGVATSVLTVVTRLMESFGITVPAEVSGNYRLGDIRHNYACIEKIQTCLGYAPEVTFEQGIAEFVKWVSRLGPNESKYEQSLAEMRERGLLK